LSGAARRRLRRNLPDDQGLRLLTDGDLELEGRLRDASNTTLRAFVTLDDVSARCVYKPISGERPLWDFPDGTLAAREVAAYEVSRASGWNLVPPTVMRDGPLGFGACQLWVDETNDDASTRVGFVRAEELPAGWHTIAAAQDDDGTAYLLAHADDPVLARMALFDVVVNNADRKGGHVLHCRDGTLRGIDHGVCFHVEAKLRTVLWGWIGQPVPEAELAVLAELKEELGSALGARLCALLAADEVEATQARLDRLLSTGVFPGPLSGRPAVPWPPM
jgi:uncharacterized repeat protein (TIGR03843 family)